MNKALKIVLISIAGIFMIGIFGLMYIGAKAPETYIYTENEIPQKYRNQLLELSLVSKNERIVFLYSDAMFDIKEGVYLLTDKHLILYMEDWDEPETIIDFSEIDFLDITYDKSFLRDSYITVETDYGMSVEFPVSSEKDRDRDFFRLLEKEVADAH